MKSRFLYMASGVLRKMVKNKEVTELNGKVQFSSKVHFFGEL